MSGIRATGYLGASVSFQSVTSFFVYVLVAVPDTVSGGNIACFAGKLECSFSMKRANMVLTTSCVPSPCLVCCEHIGLFINDSAFAAEATEIQ